ncbi:MAG TPA: hypothetical protein VGF07_07750 [Stellaceae bacterium]|jgi:hypothetical protein
MPDGAHGEDGQVSRSVAAALAFFGLYMLFAGNGQAAELIVGGCAAALTLSFELALHKKTEQRLTVRPAELKPMVPACGQLVIDTCRIAAALAAALLRPPPRGELGFVSLPDRGAAAGSGARAMAIVAASLAPNSYVVAGDAGRGPALVHRLLHEKSETAG